MVNDTLLLDSQQIKDFISLDEVLEIVNQVFCAYGEKKTIMPAKITLDMREMERDSWINAMPGYIKTMDIAGIKWAGGFGENRKNSFPYIIGTIILNDPHSGRVLAVMDGTHITNLRTGAAAALTAKYTAREDSCVVSFIGAGMQSWKTIKFLGNFFDIKEVRISELLPKRSERFKKSVEENLDLSVNIFIDRQKAVEDADIVFTSTDADEPLVLNSWLKDGVTAISLGSYQELEEKFTLEADKIIVDDIDQCLHRGELKKSVEKGLLTKDDIFANLGEIACGEKPGRELPSERILAIPIGLGLHDIAIAYKVYQRASKKTYTKKIDFKQYEDYMPT